MKLNVLIHEEDGHYWAEIPALKGCIAIGESRTAILINIKEAAKEWLEEKNVVEDIFDENIYQLKIEV